MQREQRLTQRGKRNICVQRLRELTTEKIRTVAPDLRSEHCTNDQQDENFLVMHPEDRIDDDDGYAFLQSRYRSSPRGIYNKAAPPSISLRSFNPSGAVVLSVKESDNYWSTIVHLHLPRTGTILSERQQGHSLKDLYLALTARDALIIAFVMAATSNVSEAQIIRFLNDLKTANYQF